MTKSFFIITLVLIAFSCKKETKNTPSEFINTLENSPEVITVGNNSLSLGMYLNRDFMPICEEDGRPLFCIAELKNSLNLDLNETIQLKKIYVIDGEKVWSKAITETNMSFTAVTGMAADGPKWGPDIDVDVVCEFVYNGTLRRIIAKNQHIEMTI